MSPEGDWSCVVLLVGLSWTILVVLPRVLPVCEVTGYANYHLDDPLLRHVLSGRRRDARARNSGVELI
jgi:hypothetical protein